MATTAATEIEYPSSDGQPMAETPIHVEAIMLLHQALQDFFHDRPDVFIASDIFWYWRQGYKDECAAPDVMVVPGVVPRKLQDRRSFFSWEENGAIPAIVFEIASQGTWEDDIDEKFDLYEKLGVREYVMFDPEAKYLVPPIQAYRLRGSSYRRIRSTKKVCESELGFGMRAEGPILRLIDLKTGQPILTRAERADAERQRADTLQAEVERLKAMLQQHGLANGNGS